MAFPTQGSDRAVRGCPALRWLLATANCGDTLINKQGAGESASANGSSLRNKPKRWCSGFFLALLVRIRIKKLITVSFSSVFQVHP